ncbi:MAG: ARMT1-like domain-containing protein, partial [bacterium]
MRGFLECQACFLRQALEAARYVTEDESVQALAISRVHEALAEIDYRLPPPLIARLVYGVVRDTTGVEDPYLAAKKESNELALGLYQWAQEKVADSASPLGVALKLAIAANVVDYGIGNRFDLRESLENVMTRSLDIDESARLFDELSQARVLLYLGDNSGEIVFDKLLLEKIGGRFPLLKKFFAVRGGPVINDITMDDADKVQLGDVAAVIS